MFVKNHLLKNFGVPLFLIGQVVFANGTEPFFELNAIREKAREVLTVHCGACHVPSSLFVKPEALKIYDLSHSDWAASLNQRQLEDLTRRLKDRVGMTPKELSYVMPKGAEIPRRPNAEEIQILQKFVTLEILKRSSL